MNNDYIKRYREFANEIKCFGWVRTDKERGEENEAARLALLRILKKLKNTVPDDEYIERNYNVSFSGHFGYVWQLFRVDFYLRDGHYANASNELVDILAMEPFLQKRIMDNLIHTLEKNLCSEESLDLHQQP